MNLWGWLRPRRRPDMQVSEDLNERANEAIEEAHEVRSQISRLAEEQDRIDQILMRRERPR